MNTSRGLFFTLGIFAMACTGAAELILPATALERSLPVTATYRTTPQATGKGELHVQWTDVLSRVVEDRSVPVELLDETEIRFPLDLRRAIATQNQVKVHFSFEGKNKKGERDHREEDASSSFIAIPPDVTWWDYMIIMWQDNSAASFEKMKSLGVNAGKSPEHSPLLPDSPLRNDLRWYVENMATDFYAPYHIYRADRPYNADWLRAKEMYKANPAGKEGLKRRPSLSDPAWLTSVQERLVRSARTHAPYRPIFYNLADESGIAELAGFWDFDFSDYSLDGMRRWLKQSYGTLAALNRQWESAFTRWDDVTPDTTVEAMKRANENYSSWSDHKEWMDISFANALKMGVDAIHSVDPHAYVGIEGAQMPGWGGYDYSRLTATLQAMEPYDIGNNIEIIRSLNPQIAIMTTAFARGPWEKHRLWYELLHGARGHIVWDEKYEVAGKDGVIGARGEEVAPYWTELRNGIGALLIDSERQSGPVAIHYSQASMRAEWMRAQRLKGDEWMARMSSTERKDSDFLRLRESYCRLIEDEGLQYKFVAYGQVEEGELIRGGYRVLILPQSSALSAAEAGAIAAFVRQGGTLVIDGDAGIFDEHSRLLPQSSLSAIESGTTGLGHVVRLNALNYHRERIVGKEAQLHLAMGKVFDQAGVHPLFRVTGAEGKPVVGVETHEFRNGGVTIVGLLSNPQLSVDELGPPEFKSNQRFEKPQAVLLTLPGNLYAYDIRGSKFLGQVKELSLTVDPYEPSMIAVSPLPMPPLRVSAPPRIARGETGHIGVWFDGASPARSHIFHVVVKDPANRSVYHYSGNLEGPGGRAEKALPLARNEMSGRWSIEVKDVLTGQQQTANFEVF